MKPFSIVVAMDAQKGIGLKGQLPWHLPEDLKEFKRITSSVSDSSKKNAVIMGRKTWESIPDKFRPLPGRVNIVLSRGILKLPANAVKATSISEAFDYIERELLIESAFVIGGGDIFKQAIQEIACQKLFITYIQQSFDCDVFFPAVEDSFVKTKESPAMTYQSMTYQFVEYRRK